MLTEGYGGICPNCGYDRMMYRYGSDGYYQFDACPNCGFAYAQNGEYDEYGWKVWKAIIQVESKCNPEIKTVHDIKKWMDLLPNPSPPYNSNVKTVFAYESEFVKKVMKLVDKQAFMKERVLFI